MSKSSANPERTKIQRICTLWTHDDNFSKEDIVFNAEKFPGLPTAPGTLLQIVNIKSTVAERDFQTSAKPKVGASQDQSANVARAVDLSRRGRRGSITVTIDGNGPTTSVGRDADVENTYVFAVTETPPDLKSKYANLQLSISERIAKVFGLRNRMQVLVAEADEGAHEAHHVELAFRDEYLARADMWRLAISELSKRTIYRGQKLLFMGTIKATIKHIYINGQSKQSGYFSPRTKPVFRSESARYVLFLQMSKEMWDVDIEGAGEIMFNRVVSGFLPDLFKRWLKTNVRHLVTIILFTRMQYGSGIVSEKSAGALGDAADQSRDYYRVVVSDMASVDWIQILYQLKKEFRTFLKDVSIVNKSDGRQMHPENGTDLSEANMIVTGKPSSASEGNILEAINLAAAQFSKDYIDRDLVRTGISVVVVTPGTGVFEVDYNMLKLTTDTLMGSGIGIDLVCLSPMPLHSVPLFKYRNPQMPSAPGSTAPRPPGERRASVRSMTEHDEKTPRQYLSTIRPDIGADTAASSHVRSDKVGVVFPDSVDGWSFAMPYWIDVSFWSGASDDILGTTLPWRAHKVVKRSRKRNRVFALRCRLHELQMMGVMENELGSISIPYLQEDYRYSLDVAKSGRHNQQYGRPNMSTGRAPMTAPGSYSSRGERELANVQLDEAKIAVKDCMEAFDDKIFCLADQKHIEFEQWPVAEACGKRSPESSQDLRSGLSFQGTTGSLNITARPSSDAQARHDRSSRLEEHFFRSTVQLESRQNETGIPRADVVRRQKILTADTLNNNHARNLPQHDSGDDSLTGRDTTQPSLKESAPEGEAAPSKKWLDPAKGLQSNTVKGTAEVKQRPSNWILRQISFGGKATVAQPTVSGATIDISHGKVKPAMLTVEKNQKGAIAERLASSRLTTSEKPSKPIAIRTISRSGYPPSGSPSFNQAGRSAETVKGPDRHHTVSQSSSVVKDPGSTFLLAGSRAMGDSILAKPTLSSSGGAKEITRVLSPTSAITPWAVLVNPCNPKKNSIDSRNQFRRWHHVFPRTLRTGTVKWRSLCSPAAVPLTHEWFPTQEQIATEYSENPYKITQNEDDDSHEVPRTRDSLIRELIAFRLSHGFQIIVGSAVAEFSGREEKSLASILAPDYMSCDGDTIFMSIGDSIHQLACVAGGEVEVKRYSRKPTTKFGPTINTDSRLPYKAYIRTAFENGYEPRDIILQSPRKDYNWNFIDTFLAGYHDELSDVLRFWRARFVLIPVEIPLMNRRPLPMLAEDSEEEIRLEGIRKLTQLWQRHRFIPPEERNHQSSTAKKQKDPNPLAIEYHTRDPSTIVTAGPEISLFGDADHELQTSLFSDSEKYQSSNIDLKALADDLQGEKGIQMIDRRWHWKLHHTCFLGFDLVNWLLSNFKDLETRDEAVELGNELMMKGLFVHVQKRHPFRDGNFFFQIAAEYRAPRPDSRMGGWFGMRKFDKSVPSTPLGDGPRTSPLLTRSNNGTKSRPSTADSSSASESSQDGEKTPKRTRSIKRKVALSRVMRYDVDTRKRSYRPEIISLHYDRLHNPDNCYHIRIDWMNVTAKLIEDAIVTWATSVEKYGLKLVEVPIAEVARIVDHHPFRSPYSIKLALQPPPAPPEAAWDGTYMATQYAKTDRFVYHKALLRKLNFVLDMEAASCFPEDIEVGYSWGTNDYRYTQFIHRSGTLLAQVTDDGNFILLANRLAHSRSKDSGRVRITDPYEYKKALTDGTQSSRLPSTPAVERGNPHRSPFSSPLARPVQDSNMLQTALHDASKPSVTSLGQGFAQTPEQIKDDVEAFCSNAELLSVFYSEAFKQAPSPSPRILPTLDHNIPNLGLPPAISIREASPASTAWSLNSSFAPRAGMAESGIAGRRQGSEGSMSTSGKRGSVAESSGKEERLRRQRSQGSMGDESEAHW